MDALLYNSQENKEAKGTIHAGSKQENTTVQYMNLTNEEGTRKIRTEPKMNFFAGLLTGSLKHRRRPRACCVALPSLHDHRVLLLPRTTP